ncbi:hypothetical protein HK096_010718, partial [Nowakowskiella sp. JEL0078]
MNGNHKGSHPNVSSNQSPRKTAPLTQATKQRTNSPHSPNSPNSPSTPTLLTHRTLRKQQSLGSDSSHDSDTATRRLRRADSGKSRADSNILTAAERPSNRRSSSKSHSVTSSNSHTSSTSSDLTPTQSVPSLTLNLNTLDSKSNSSKVSFPHRPIPKHRPTLNTVLQLNPDPSVALPQSASIHDAAAYMAAKRQDAVLITDADNQLIGILTDKDITYRVVAEGLDPFVTPVTKVMTANPISVTASSSANEALNKMVAGMFRHLPVVEDDDLVDSDGSEGGGGVVGVLDVTKCLYGALEKLDRVYDYPDGVGAPPLPTVVGQKQPDQLKEQLEAPDLAGMLAEQSESPPVIGMNASVKDAARIMKSLRETAVLVFDSDSEHEGMGQLAGIFTTKDLVLRVVAAGSDPASTP